MPHTVDQRIPELVSPIQYAEITGMSPRTVRYQVEQGHIPARQIGTGKTSVYVIRRALADEYVARAYGQAVETFRTLNAGDTERSAEDMANARRRLVDTGRVYLATNPTMAEVERSVNRAAEWLTEHGYAPPPE